MNNVDDFIFTSHVIPNELCKSLIKECEEAAWTKHKWSTYGQKESEYSAEQKELDTVYSTTKQFHTLGPLIMKTVMAYQEKVSWPEDHCRPSWIQRLTQVRFNRYKKGTQMRTHYDHIQSMFDGKLKGIPILSIVGLLNDNYEGGEFMMRGKEVKLVRGDILIFPSNFMYPHKVKDITEGVRHSFVSWAF
jgi:predicted 2-oxoglutarate/Fe(II)-dependent dioxygenase YbiX